MNPKILALDTSTDACSVALITATQTFVEFDVVPQGHSKILLGMVERVCAAAGVSLDAVDAFAFGQGPGSFTGLRIAASVVQGLAFGANKPVVAVSSLQALAQQAFNLTSDTAVTNLTNTHIIPILDARMQEVYWGAYLVNKNGLVDMIHADCLNKPDEIKFDGKNEYIAVGTGCDIYGDLIRANNSHLTIIEGIQYPRAQEIAQLAISKFINGDILTPSAAVPVYIRNDVAQTSKKNPD